VRIRKAVLYGAGDLRLEEEDLPPLAPGQVLVRTEVTAFSTGTDLGNYEGRSTEVPGAPDYPRAVGYSNAGVVAEVGSAVTAVRPGDRVFALKPHCSAYVAGPADLLVPIPDAVDSAHASLAYLVQLGVAALRQARYEAGESVCVIGLGVIGLATVAVARAMGAYVTAVANSETRAALAGRLGALEPRPDADVVVLTANTWSAWRAAMETARVGGRVSVLGFPGRNQPAPGFNPLDARWLYAKQLAILGAGYSPRVDCAPADLRFNLRRNLEFILDLMARGDLDLRPAISHRLPAERMREAYDLAAAHSKQLTAAVFEW